MELKVRKKGIAASIFSGRVQFGVCGGYYSPKTWHSNSKYRKVVWQCYAKYEKKGSPCSSPHCSEAEFKDLIVRAVNKIIADKDRIIKDFEETKDQVFDTSKQAAELEELQIQRAEIIDQMKQLTAQNAAAAMDQDAYTSQFNQLSERYTAVQDQLVLLEKSIQDIQYRKTRTDMFLESLKQQESLIPEFSSELWYSLVDHAMVYSKKDIRVIFKNGVEIKA